MIYWRHLPMLKLAAAFAVGIGLKGLGIPFPPVLLLAVTALYVLLLLLEKRLISHRVDYLQGVLASSLFACLGMTHYAPHTQQVSQDLVPLNCHSHTFIGTVQSPVKSRAYGSSFQLHILGANTQGGSIPLNGKVLCKTQPHTSITFSLYDTVYVHGFLTDFQTPYPDYASYMAQQGIFHTLYEDTLLNGGLSYHPGAWGIKLQQNLAQNLLALIHTPEAQEIALAMFLGDKSHLSQETREPFTQSGASHILAISGMHIGIIFLLLNALLSFLHVLPHGKRIKHGVILFLLLAYMLLTGMSPAVVRATLMFGLILLFRIFLVRFALLNVIATAALIQLYLHPELLFQPGFQLSYSAVLGIIVGFPYFERWFTTPWKGVNYFYSWIGVSLCASLTTAPFIAYHFGTFPVYFLLTNILITTLSAVIVWVGFLTVLCSYLPYVAPLLGKLCELLLNFLFQIVSWIAGLPFGQITHFDLLSGSWGILGLELVLAGILLVLPHVFSTAANKAAKPI